MRDATANIRAEVVGKAADELLRTCGGSATLLDRMNGEVRRYHTWHLNRQQTVADHTWHVMRIYVALFGLPDAPLLYEIMYHDYEMLTGDLQHPIKSMVPELKAICDEAELAVRRRCDCEPMGDPTGQDVWRIKLCDLLEMYEFATRELMSGNYGTGDAVRYRITEGLDRHYEKGMQIDTSYVHDIRKSREHVYKVDQWTRRRP